MEEITRLYRKKKLDLEDLEITDKKTGEIKEFSKGSITQTFVTNQVLYNYQSFVYLNTIRLTELVNNIKPGDLALLVTISLNLLYNYNICMLDKEKPHTTSSISKIIGNSVQATKVKLDRLVALGVLAYQKIPGRKDLGKVYIVNPLYIKLGDKHSESLPKIFGDIHN